MATNKQLYDESSRKTYNNIDSWEQLMYVEVTKNTFAGYRRELLIRSLSEVESDFYVCTECKGVMRNACQIGEEQNSVCEVCVTDGMSALSMVKSRSKILELRAKCPLATRGCKWNGKIPDIEEHLILCEKVVVKCLNDCDAILPRSELDLHLTSFCVKRPVICEHCDQYFRYEELTNHYLMCLEYQVSCPYNCNVNLKRKLLYSHIELECPNKVVECPYKKFGCGQEVLRCELEEHKKTKQLQHLEFTSIFAIREMEQLKQTNIQLTETNIQLSETNIQRTETIKQLTDRMITLENQVEKLSYPIILRDEFIMPDISYQRTRYSKKVNWKFLRISVEFDNSFNNQHTSVSVVMENDDTRTPLAKWPFEGRFKLTIIDNQCHFYESCFIKLQPRSVSKDKGEYPSEFILAQITRKCFQEDRYSTDIEFKFTLQIQEIENQ